MYKCLMWPPLARLPIGWFMWSIKINDDNVNYVYPGSPLALGEGYSGTELYKRGPYKSALIEKNEKNLLKRKVVCYTTRRLESGLAFAGAASTCLARFGARMNFTLTTNNFKANILLTNEQWSVLY